MLLSLLSMIHALFGTGCASEGSKSAELKFEKISLRITGTTAECTVYELTRTDSGLFAEHFLETECWSDEEQDLIRIRTDSVSLEAAEEVYDRICRILGDCRVRSWDGFSGSDPEVLDGGGFSLTVTCDDGTEIRASGTNSYPKNYVTFRDAVTGLFSE